MTLLAQAAQAQQPTPPPSVAARILALDTACNLAGGRPVARPYVFVHDFTGEGVNDFLISEGDYNCSGPPELFRSQGRAFVEIWVVEPSAAGGARRAYREQVTGYRIIDSRPRTIQLVRSGSACGPGVTGTCTVPLAWDAQSRGFVAGSRPGVAAVAPPRPQQAAAPPPATPAAVTATAAARAPETQTAFQARCRRETLAANPSATNWVDGACRDKWGLVTAANPAVDAILAVVSAAPGTAFDAAGTRTRLAAVRWAARPQTGDTATGTLGLWAVSLRTAPAPQLSFHWSKVGDMSPFDVPEALKVRGATVTEVACMGYGAVEQNRVYRVDAPGRAPFGLTVYDRGAPVANAEASYGATVDLNAPPPTLAAVRRSQGSDWGAKCE